MSHRVAKTKSMLCLRIPHLVRISWKKITAVVEYLQHAIRLQKRSVCESTPDAISDYPKNEDPESSQLDKVSPASVVVIQQLDGASVLLLDSEAVPLLSAVALSMRWSVYSQYSRRHATRLSEALD
jgi:hypothetical protein